MKTIWRISIDPYDPAGISDIARSLPAGARPVHAGLQGSHGVPQPLGVPWEPPTIAVWFEVETDHPHEVWEFTLVGTGQLVPDALDHLGTVQLSGIGLVLHVYGRQP